MKRKILLLISLYLLAFVLPLDVQADTIRYKWYKVVEKNINYVKESKCNTLINKQDYRESILYENEKDTKNYINNNEVFFRKGKIEKQLDTEYVEYIGFKNASSTNNYLIINHIYLYNQNKEEVTFNYLKSGNMDPDSVNVFINNKRYLAFLNDGYVYLVLHNKIKASDLKIIIDAYNPEVIKNITLFASIDKDNITYTKDLNSSISKMSTHTLNEFNINNSYYVDSFIYYEKLYKCYEEEKEYRDGYYEYIDGYIKDENDFIVESDEEILTNNLNNKNISLKQEKETYLEPIVLYHINDYVYKEKPEEEVKKLSKTKENINIKQKDKNIKKEQNNINIFYLILTSVVITIIFAIIYFAKKCRTK